ncbi:Methyltransferase type 11 [Chloroherpeton thalassium ATCC 35110]|uniref:Methyltransferase type 11 n=1 Tax=Chloroherpeton thalassium (strain ATCC 35110 / GB-78) TaxID=517418 RepID=B3QXI5_CHLT3|nr:class I SAM-dependent methyltransferase [Chloroherpeton thalassium]ACF13459.1 Methyltransferase type 11 [Chloroherpeton thalassium ATCC 35110]
MEQETHWSRFATDFEKRNHYVAGKRNINAIKDELFQLKLTGKVLELGCGNGTYSQILADSADELFATDYSKEMVSFSAQRLNERKNVHVEQQDCFSLSYPDASFDAVVMVNLLHIIANPEKALQESSRVLKVSGTVVVVSFTIEGMNLFQKLGMGYRYLRTYGKPPAGAQTLTVEHTCDMLINCGFVITESKLIGHNSKAVFVRAKLV